MSRDEVIRMISRLWLPLALVIIVIVATRAFDAYDVRHVAAEQQEVQVRMTALNLSRERLQAERDKQGQNYQLASRRLDASKDQSSASFRFRETFRSLQNDIMQQCRMDGKLDLRCVNSQINLLKIVSQNR